MKNPRTNIPYKKHLWAKIAISLAIALIPLLSSTIIQAESSEIANVTTYELKTKVKLEQTYNDGMDAAYSDVAEIHEFFGYDDNYYITYTDSKNVYISVLNKDTMKEIKQISIKNEYPILGNITQDKSGNYYICYGKYDTADSAESSGIVLIFAKYSKEGTLVDKLEIKGSATGLENGGTSYGTKEPFNFAQCEMAIDSKGILICFYGRIMYNGHQSSNAIYINTGTMDRVNYVDTYVSHSFDQELMIGSNGDYIFAERGDAYDRGVTLSRITGGGIEREAFVPFHFRNGAIYQHTYATIAGLADLRIGYGIVGTSERTLSYDIAKDMEFNEPRNLYLQVVAKDFTSKDTNSPNVHRIEGETRIAEGTYNRNAYLKEGSIDYGVRWLTNYTGNKYASSPKMVQISDNQMLILWEEKEFISENSPIFPEIDRKQIDYYTEVEDLIYENSVFYDSYYMVVNEKGEITTPPISLNRTRISEFQKVLYHNGYVYMTNSSGRNEAIEINKFKVGDNSNKKKIENITVTQKELTVELGKEIQVDIEVSPSNASKEHLTYSYDTDYINKKESKLIAYEPGITNIVVWSKDNKDIYEIVTVKIITPSPKNLKGAYDSEYFAKATLYLEWDEVNNAYEYEIYRSVKKDSGYKKVGTANNTYYSDSTVKSNTIYYYKVRAASEEKGLENPFSTVLLIPTIAKTTGIKIKKTTKTSILLTWKKNSFVDGYEIYKYNDSKGKNERVKVVKGGNSTSHTVKNLKTNSYNEFTIRSYKKVNGKTYYSSMSDDIVIWLE